MIYMTSILTHYLKNNEIFKPEEMLFCFVIYFRYLLTDLRADCVKPIY